MHRAQALHAVGDLSDEWKLSGAQLQKQLEMTVSRSCEAQAAPIVRKKFHSKGACEG